MTSGFRDQYGRDTDDLFDPDVTGDGPTAVFMRRPDGSGLRYAAARYGQPGDPIGFRDWTGVDQGTVWCRKGTASYAVAGLNGRTFSVNEQAKTNQSQTWANVSVTMKNDGNWSAQGAAALGAASLPAPSSGAWLTRGSVGDYQVLMEITASSGYSGYSASSSATSWQSLSTSQTASVSLPSMAANNSVSRSASATVRIRIRSASSGAVISDNTVYLNASTTGWL